MAIFCIYFRSYHQRYILLTFADIRKMGVVFSPKKDALSPSWHFSLLKCGGTDNFQWKTKLDFENRGAVLTETWTQSVSIELHILFSRRLAGAHVTVSPVWIFEQLETQVPANNLIMNFKNWHWSFLFPVYILS